MERNPQVEEYFKSIPREFCRPMVELRETIFEYFPEGEETYGYNIPIYRYKGKPLFSIAAFKDHYSVITQDKTITEKIPELKNYEISGTTIHFTIKKPATNELIKKIISIRVAEREL